MIGKVRRYWQEICTNDCLFHKIIAFIIIMPIRDWCIGRFINLACYWVVVCAMWKKKLIERACSTTTA